MGSLCCRKRATQPEGGTQHVTGGSLNSFTGNVFITETSSGICSVALDIPSSLLSKLQTLNCELVISYEVYENFSNQKKELSFDLRGEERETQRIAWTSDNQKFSSSEIIRVLGHYWKTNDGNFSTELKIAMAKIRLVFTKDIFEGNVRVEEFAPGRCNILLQIRRSQESSEDVLDVCRDLLESEYTLQIRYQTYQQGDPKTLGFEASKNFELHDVQQTNAGLSWSKNGARFTDDPYGVAAINGIEWIKNDGRRANRLSMVRFSWDKTHR